MFKPFQNSATYRPIVFLSIVPAAAEYPTERDLPCFLNFSRTWEQLLRFSKKSSYLYRPYQKKLSCCKNPIACVYKASELLSCAVGQVAMSCRHNGGKCQMTRNFGMPLAEVCGDRQNSFRGVISKVWHSAKGKIP